jgi:hypothetical protein
MAEKGKFLTTFIGSPCRTTKISVVIWVLILGHRGKEREREIVCEREIEKKRQQRYRRLKHS